MLDSIRRTSTTSDEFTGPAVDRTVELPSARISFMTSIAVGVLLILAIAGTPTSLGPWVLWVTRFGAALVGGLILLLYTRRRYGKVMRESRRQTTIWHLPDYQVNILQRSAGRSGGPLTPELAGVAQAKAFTFSVIYPADVRQRITERYEPSQRTLKQRVTIDAQLPGWIVRQLVTGERQDHATEATRGVGNEQGMTVGATRRSDAPAQPTVLFPVLIPRKGEMVDNLHVLAADESTLPVLSYRQYLQLVARVLRTLLTIAYGGSLNQQSQATVFQAEHDALRGVIRRARGNIKDDTGSQGIAMLGDEGARPLSNHAARGLAAKLVKKLTSHYAIVAAVPCPADGRLVITYERLITPTLELAPRPRWTRRGDSDQPARLGGTLKWFKARLRLLFGARPVDISVALDNAWTTQSYHLVLDGQEGVFVGSQESRNLIKYLMVHWDRIKRRRHETIQNWARQSQLGETLETPPPPYYRFRRRAGQRYAHFYTRFFPEPVENLVDGETVPKVRFRFYEVPPGSVFRAAVTAVASALLVWLIGFVTSRKPDPGTDVPAFLLVFPAIAAAWLGFEGQTRRLLEGTLASRLSLLTTVLTSIAASGLFMIYKSGLPYLHWSNPFDMRIVGIESLSWTVLVLVAVLNACFVTFAYLGRTSEFILLSGRMDTFGGVVEHGDD